MTVEERIMSRGRFDIRLKPDTPREIVDAITEYSIIYIVPARGVSVDNGLFPGPNVFPGTP